jgi:hypothetical protein
VTRALSLAAPDEVVVALGARHVVASGIASWLPADLALWRALDARLSLVGGAAAIELVTFERPLDASRALDPLGRLVDAVAEALDAAPKTRSITPVLAELGEREESVELRRADGVPAEARAIADAVHEALSAGTPPERIAIVTPDDSPVRGALVRLLASMGIAAHVTGEDGSRGGGLVACSLEALAVAGHGVPRLALATLLRSPYLDARRVSGLTGDDEARVAVRRLARVLERTRNVAAEHPADALARTVLSSREPDPEARTGLASLARRIGEMFERAASGARRAEHASRARRLVEELGLHAVVGPGAAAHLAGDRPTRGLAHAEVHAFVRDERGKRTLDAALIAYEAATSRLALDAPTTYASFLLELQQALLDEETDAVDVPSLGAVRITPLRDLPSRPLALLVLADTLGDAPESERTVTLLDAAARVRLMDTIEPALRPSVFAAQDPDAVRLASAADAASRIVVSYATRDEDGTLRSPHPLVGWLEGRGVREARWQGSIIADRSVATRFAAERADIEWRRERSFGLVPSDSAARAEAGMSDASRAILTEETGGAERPMSVTALDRFGACAFQGFAAEVLGARSKPILDEIMGPREEGIVLHGALAAAFEATRELWSKRPRDAEAIRKEARRAAATFLGRDRAPSRQLRASLDEVADRVATVIEWSLADEVWDFAGAEIGFGKRADPWDAVLLGIDRTTVRLTGSIDRVDASHETLHLRVIDYKRSEDGARRLTGELGEASFQLAVYARAASRARGKPVVTSLYLPTRHLSIAHRTRGSDAAWTRAHTEDHGLPRFERRALELMERVRRGDVEPRPATPDKCRWCDHDGACRKPRFVIEGTLADDPDEARARA